MNDRTDIKAAIAGAGDLRRPLTSVTPSPRHLRHPAGFSFAEVLFAVVILGIGFILVAAIFPVAISQTQTTVDDSAAAAAAARAAGVIAAVPSAVPNPVYDPTATTLTSPASVRQLTLFPPTVRSFIPPSAPPVGYLGALPAGFFPPAAVVVPLTGLRASLVQGNLINATDPRFAYVPFYRRENGSPVAQLIVVAVAARNRPVYDPTADLAVPTNYDGAAPMLSTLTAAQRAGLASAYNVGTYTVCPDQASFTATLPAGVGEGCATAVNAATGRSYQLGSALYTTGTPKFALEAAGGLSVGPGPDGLWGTPDDVLDVAPAVQPSVPTGTLQPVAAYARVFAAAGSIGGRITLSLDLAHAVAAQADVFTNVADTQNVAPDAAVQGAFVVVADDYPYDPANPTSSSFTLPANATLPAENPRVGSLNGRIYRLGPPVPADKLAIPPIAPGTFELDPQYAVVPPATTTDVLPIPANTPPKTNPRARVWVVGAGRANALSATDANPTNTLNAGRTGASEAIGVYSTYFPVQ